MSPQVPVEEAPRADGPSTPGMLYFTFLEKKGGALRAIYNGRFAFLREFPPIVAARVELTTVADDAEKASQAGLSPDTFESLSEEKRHQALFLPCESGLFLNGLRFLARVVWLTSRREALPRLYYRLRTQFFLEMYEIHEKLADLLPQEEEKASEIEGLKKDIADEDQRLLRQWRGMLGKGRFWVLKPVAMWLGKLLSRHFAVVTVDARSPGKTATNVATGGWLNTSGSFGERKSRPIERILTWLRPEAWLRISDIQVWQWMILKFQEERREIFRQTSDDHRAEALYASYVQKIVAFLSLYMEIEDQLSVFRLEKLLLAVESPAAQQPPAAWLEKKEIFAVVGFFYGHGN